MQITQTLLSLYLLCFIELLYFIPINSSDINRRKMENSRTCEICNVNVHRASMQKHLRSESYSENIKQNKMFIPEWLYKQEQTHIRKKIQKVYNPKTLKQLAREKIELDDKN